MKYFPDLKLDVAADEGFGPEMIVFFYLITSLLLLPNYTTPMAAILLFLYIYYIILLFYTQADRKLQLHPIKHGADLDLVTGFNQ